MNAPAARLAPARPFSPCRCGARYEPGAFERLDVVRVLDVDELAPIVVRWPNGVTVDVRACAACKTPLARLVQRQRQRPSAAGFGLRAPGCGEEREGEGEGE